MLVVSAIKVIFVDKGKGVSLKDTNYGIVLVPIASRFLPAEQTVRGKGNESSKRS